MFLFVSIIVSTYNVENNLLIHSIVRYFTLKNKCVVLKCSEKYIGN